MKHTILIFSLLCFQYFFAQPANDAPCSAISITVGSGCVMGDVTSATTEGLSTPSCWTGPPSNYSTSVWYSFVATDDSITVNLGDGTLGSQSNVAVYSGTCGSLTQIGCAKGGAEADVTGLAIGTTYFIMVDGQGNNVGTFCISTYETPPPPPPIGTCLNPRNLYVATDCNNISGLQFDEQNNMISTNTATGGDGGASMAGAPYTNSIEQTCAGTDAGQQGYWVEFTATGTTNTVFNNAGSTGYDYTIFTGADCASLTAQQCFTIAAGGTRTVGSVGGAADDLVVGTTYKVLITPASTGTATTAFLCLTGTAFVPPNNSCASATTLQFGQNYSLTNANATVDLNNTLCSGSTENNVWVRYTATYTGTAYVFLQDQDCACSNGLQMSIFNAGAACPNNSSTCSIYINPNNDNDFNGSFSVTNGSTYYIQIDGYAGCSCTFNLCLNSSNAADCSALLPIELLSFNPFFVDEKIVKIEWNTLSEQLSDYFEVERSLDGYSYQPIGRAKAAGESSSKLHYEIFDENPHLYGVSYYRLIQKDVNGVSQVYKPVSVVGPESEKLHLYPNPTREKINLELPHHAGDILIRIYNQMGLLVYEYQRENNSDFYSIDVNGYEKGIYIIQVRTEEKIFTEKFMRE